MPYSPDYQTNPKIPTFVTKVPHDVVLTQTDTRLFIKNIKTGVTIEQFKSALEKYGPVQVYLYEHGLKDNGWAWVGFEDKETALKAVRDCEYGEAEVRDPEEEEINVPHEGAVKNEEDKQETSSFYAEAEENVESEEHPNNNNDENVKNRESDSEEAEEPEEEPEEDADEED